MVARWLGAVGLAVGLGAAVAAGGPPASLGDKVVAFCAARKGETVSTGECSALANTALRSAGARTRGKDSPNEGDYTWGELVVVLEAGKPGQGKPADLRPGDVLQLRDTKWEGPRRNAKGTYTKTLKHHTAVVAAVEEKGTLVRVFHQNYGGKREVMDGTFYPADLTEGWVRAYRPVPK